jgi:hypothetical protein
MRLFSALTFASIAFGFAACADDKDGGTNGASGNAGSGGSSTGGTAGQAGGSGQAPGGGSGKAGSGAGGGAGSNGQGGSGAMTAGTGAAAGLGGAAGRSGTAGSGTGGMSDGGEAGMSGTGGMSGMSGMSGTGGMSGNVTPLPGMNFFVTSTGMPNGGDLGGLAGADAFCKQLATAVSATLGAKTWRAYLSTSEENARDRIGTGPWRNQAGIVIANNVTDLHAQAAGEALDDTWPPADLSIALDETGAQVANSAHDILTGSNADGTVLAASTCMNWTSDSDADTAGVGHSNRDGGGRPPSFNATHTVGCAPFTMNYEDGTVSSGGGRGSLYCFALEPSSGT